MKNNFKPIFPFQKKQSDPLNKTLPPFLLKSTQSTFTNPQKPVNITEETINKPFIFKATLTIDQDSFNSEHQSSCRSSQITTKGNRPFQRLQKQRKISPIRYQKPSPQNRPISPKPFPPKIHLSKQSIPVRATLKNLVQGKFCPSQHRQASHSKQVANPMASNRQQRAISGYRMIKTATDIPVRYTDKNYERQNQILREENQLLRSQLNELKRSVIFGAAGKRQETICNLRATIKKEDCENKELKLKLEIMTKKIAALTNLLQNKDEQIHFLISKITQSDQQLKQIKQKHTQKINRLKQKTNFLLNSYNDLESKWNQSELQWQNFKQQWFDEKSIYIHRISFLQDYISNNH